MTLLLSLPITIIQIYKKIICKTEPFPFKSKLLELLVIIHCLFFVADLFKERKLIADKEKHVTREKKSSL
jgi:hypothetical protein